MKIILIIPYFGKFLNYFDLWVKSIEKNETIDFLLFTDCKIEFAVPKNLKIVNMTFEEFRENVSNKFDFKIRLKEPYKICDFRPAYGYLFAEYLKEYDFWGYCDVDLIFGNIRNFITDEILLKYDKIYSHGHLTLFKNNEFNNKLFMKKYKDLQNYKQVFSMNWSCHFDEYPGISDIAEREDIKIFNDGSYADLDVFSYNFKKVYRDENKNDKKDIKEIYCWEDGKLYGISLKDNELLKREYIYIHLQKRNMKYDSKIDSNKFLIIPNQFLSLDQVITENKILEWTENKEYYVYKEFRKKVILDRFKLEYWKFKILQFKRFLKVN